MADPESGSQQPEAISFIDFPEDVQLCILSFLSPSEIANFSLTSKRFVSLFRSDSKLWFSLCDRRWGSKTLIKAWSRNGQIPFHLLYKTLSRLDSLIGFWRRSDGYGKPQASGIDVAFNSPSLVFFEWGPSSVTGSSISPGDNGYAIRKTPFLWLGLSPRGEPVYYISPIGRGAELGNPEEFGVIPVNVWFVGGNHFVIEENSWFARQSPSTGDLSPGGAGSPPDQVMSEIYQYFANPTSPPARDRVYRRTRKEKLRSGRRLWEAEHYVKIVNCSPTPSRPLQGLWKGTNIDANLVFYLVAYDDIGGIACRRVGDSSGPFSGCAPVFWTTSTTFIESPFSSEERRLYDGRMHARPSLNEVASAEKGAVSRILYINSSYDLVLPDLAGSPTGSSTEGRIWQYKDGTFGFGFLRDHFIIDLQHIALNGLLLDAV